ncbi:MAG: acetyl-CoA carboxylase biotin carboxylase subunit [Bacteroidales bacterium]|nr:acetyl-CoA carboxylase biotin carboxylase subunit [Bacteroidales bacterium]
MKLFHKILIANRGEIAVRIIRSAKKLGIQTVAVYSEIDQEALHVSKADEAFCIGKQELSETYLNIEKIIEVAKKSHCDAIHPGYGFLSENPLFIEACEKAGITFIGPHTRAIRLMGNKIESRNFVKKLNIPMTEAITGSPAQLLKNAHTIPFPILVKAAAGGGGKGMRIVYKPEELESVLESTAREAKNYFGDGTIFIEKYVEEPRHIEFQVIGDNFGSVIHLFERECTIQRRYQKIIEESPSATLTPEVRKKMGDAAVAIAKAVDYNSAGTVEFLVDKNLDFYFLEMNTRIQVEHPVTEMVLGIDLVDEQIRVAAGNKLRFKQSEISQNGHAIECRIYAEDPANNFMPAPGEISYYRQPDGENIRVDTGLEKAQTVLSNFDPMLSKMIVWGNDRSVAIKKSTAALKDYTIHGIQTNIPYLLEVLNHPAFADNKISTKFCDEHTPEILEKMQKPATDPDIFMLGFALYSLNKTRLSGSKNIWEDIGFWRSNMNIPFEMDGNTKNLQIQNQTGMQYELSLDGKTFRLCLKKIENNHIRFRVNDSFYKAVISQDNKGLSWVSIEGSIKKLLRTDLLNGSTDHASSGAGDGENLLYAPMPGKVIKINVKAGEQVKRGTILLVVEAMKMENNIIASSDATVEKVNVKEGEMVGTDLQLLHLLVEEVAE